MPDSPTSPSIDTSQTEDYRVAFFGWCEDAFDETLLDKYPALTLRGICRFRASNIFPIPLAGHILLFALRWPSPGEMFDIKIRDSLGSEAVSFQIGIRAAEITHPDGSVVIADAGTPLPEWFLYKAHFGGDFLIATPGLYQVIRLIHGREVPLGSFELIYLPAPELTPDVIAGVEGHPFAMRAVRMRLECRICKDQMSVYAALNRNEKLEAEGCKRDVDLPDAFVCGCKVTSIDLRYLRSGLRGLLLRREPLVSAHLDFVKLYEKSALEEECRQFKKLLDEDGSEERLQSFLERNPVFFARFNPQRIIFKCPVLTRFKTDFAILNERKELLLIEIENSSTPLLKQDGGARSELQHAADQVRCWLQVFAEHRGAALGCIGLKLEEVANVRGVIVAGRTPRDESQAKQFRTVQWGGIEIFTFDDLLSCVVEISRLISNPSTPG